MARIAVTILGNSANDDSNCDKLSFFQYSVSSSPSSSPPPPATHQLFRLIRSASELFSSKLDVGSEEAFSVRGGGGQTCDEQLVSIKMARLEPKREEGEEQR